MIKKHKMSTTANVHAGAIDTHDDHVYRLHYCTDKSQNSCLNCKVSTPFILSKQACNADKELAVNKSQTQQYVFVESTWEKCSPVSRSVLLQHYHEYHCKSSGCSDDYCPDVNALGPNAHIDLFYKYGCDPLIIRCPKNRQQCAIAHIYTHHVPNQETCRYGNSCRRFTFEYSDFVVTHGRLHHRDDNM